MILTYKIKHGEDFDDELRKARQVAKFAIVNKDKLSTKHVKHLGLKAAIANQILRKYGRNRKIKSVKSVNLIIPGQSIKEVDGKIVIACLKLEVTNTIVVDYVKISQVEINSEYVFVSVMVQEPKIHKTSNYIGVDLNTTGHIAVVANPQTGKVVKLGKMADHVHRKYKNIRRQLQSYGKYGRLKKVGNRESRIVRNLNHKISKKIVDTARENNCGIKLEKLTGIRKTKKNRKEFRYSLHSWSYYQLGSFIEYKAKLNGVEVIYIDPRYTSQICSRCGLIGNRNGKSFKCPHCGHVDHADANAAFNIGNRSMGIGQFSVDRDAGKGSTDTSRGAMVMEPLTPEPHAL